MNDVRRPAWAGKPVAQLSPQEIAEALEFLVTAEIGDDALRRALARQLVTGHRGAV
jgi:hypothetical protein